MNQETVSQHTHTPGPWEVVEDVGDASHGWRVKAPTDHGFMAAMLTKPDARLIAAAPDLLEACMELVLGNIDEDDQHSDEHLRYACRECYQDALDDHTMIQHDSDCLVGRAEAAIRKATS